MNQEAREIQYESSKLNKSALFKTPQAEKLTLPSQAWQISTQAKVTLKSGMVNLKDQQSQQSGSGQVGQFMTHGKNEKKIPSPNILSPQNARKSL